jgi:hypothetical protein
MSDLVLLLILLLIVAAIIYSSPGYPRPIPYPMLRVTGVLKSLLRDRTVFQAHGQTLRLVSGKHIDKDPSRPTQSFKDTFLVFPVSDDI